MSELPAGLLTILFTDIEGSTSHWDHDREAMRSAHAQHHELLTTAFTEHHGVVVKDKGDGFIVIFPGPVDAVNAAAAAQRGLRTATWPEGIDELKVRMAANTGMLEPEKDDYYGPDVNKVARLEAAAHGGQVLISDSTRALCEDRLSGDLSLKDLGLQKLRGLSHPERVYELVGEGLHRGFPALSTAADHGKPLPSVENTFVGRDEEIAAVGSLIGEGSRLVTILGPGGIGKTRLAVEAARSMEERMSGGVHFADLAPLTSADGVGLVVAEAVGVHAEGTVDVLALVAERITHPTLLVVDNFEHVVEASKSIGELLANAPALTIIATSRQPLGLRDETVYRLDPLEVSTDGGPSGAVQLFYDRVASQGVTIDDNDRQTVASICRRLDGLPLAIELVAPRARLVSIRELDEMLEESLDALGTGGADLPERQRTIRNAIEWSLRDLTESQRQLFSRLAALPAGATLKMLERICCFDLEGSPLDNLATLVDNSLVNSETGLPGGTRFRQLVPLREYGVELLQSSGGYGPAMDRLIDYYVEMGPIWGLSIQSDHSVDEMITADQPNLVAAMRWSLESGRFDEMAEVTTAMWGYWFKGDRIAPAVDWLSRVDEGHSTPAHDWLVGFFAFQQGDFETLASRMPAALAGFEKSGDEMGIALALLFGAVTVEDPEVGHSMLDRAAKTFDEDAPIAEFMTTIFKSIIDFQTGDFEMCVQRRESTLQRATEFDSDEMKAWIHWNLAWAYYGVGRFDEAGESFGYSYEYMAADAYQEGVASAGEGIALLDIRAGNVARGLRILGGASAVFDRIGTVSWFEAIFYVAQTTELVRSSIGSDEFDQCFSEGRDLTFAELIDLIKEALDQLQPAPV